MDYLQLVIYDERESITTLANNHQDSADEISYRDYWPDWLLLVFFLLTGGLELELTNHELIGEVGMLFIT